MLLDEPRWWYAGEPTLIANMLRPVSRAWDWWARRRFAVTTPYRVSLPVLCCGNFTAGGSGKTPMAIHLAARLRHLGIEPFILTRGYGGRIPGPHLVVPGRDEARDVGDEALLLARMAPTVISRDRIAGARDIEKRAARTTGRTAIIMDDGLQNPSLMKDFSIALVDAHRGVGNGLPIPAGPLRISLDFQLDLADVVVINHGAQEAVIDQGAGVWLRERFQGPVLDAVQKPSGDTSWLLGATVIAFAGIANPHRFFDLVERLGATCSERMAFPDHHRFTPSDVSALLQRQADSGATLVTTEKDFVRLSGTSCEPLRIATRVVAIETAFAERDESRIASLIDGVLQRGGANQTT